MRNVDIPKFIEPYLWWIKLGDLDLENDKKRIITNVLNYGNKQATDWLARVYSEKDIKKVLQKPLAGEWNEKSYFFWALIYGVSATLKPKEIFKQNALRNIRQQA